MEENQPTDQQTNPKYSIGERIIFTVGFFLLGFINNLGFILILTCSQQFSEQLDNPSLIALYPLAEIGFSSFARIINSRYCIRLTYITRIIALSLYFLSGFISLYVILHIVEGNTGLNNTAAFMLTLIPSLIMGTGGAFGESSVLGYLRIFPKDYVAGWSSGTGFAGVGGASITLFFKVFNVKAKYLYLYMSPVCIVYFLSFYVIDRIYKSKEKSINAMLVDEEYPDAKLTASENEEDSTGPRPVSGTVPSSIGDNTDVSENKAMSCSNFTEGFSKGKRYIINLALVYYFEYVILSGFADRISIREFIKDEPYYSKHIVYETLSLCYQIGVLLSRSSLVIVKHIPMVEIFTICQAINFLIWLLEVYLDFIPYGYILFVHMIIVGLFGGASYVGCFYFVLNSTDISPTLKELCVNIGTIFNDIGILSASATVLLLDNTIMVWP